MLHAYISLLLLLSSFVYHTRTVEFNDPLYPSQWYLHSPIHVDINVTSVWERGCHGEGVTIAIISDGVDIHHQDLIEAINEPASHDFTDTHPIGNTGTGLAGVIGSRGNNSICGVGVAYGCSISNIILAEAVTSSVKSTMEPMALNHMWDVIDIYVGAYLLDAMDLVTLRRLPSDVAEVDFLFKGDFFYICHLTFFS